MHFCGFPAAGIDLLQQNRLMNDKAFYDAHKEQIRELVQQPFYLLIEELAPTLEKIDPGIMIDPKRMLSRVRRDTRFTKDKSLYRDHLWITLGRPKREEFSRPCYYFEVSPENWSYGCGYFNVSPAEMQISRDMILAEDKYFLDAFQALKRNKKLSFYSDFFKRPKCPDAPEEYQSWLNCKELGWIASCEEFGPLLDGSFLPALKKQMLAMKPLYDFMFAVKNRSKREQANT